MASAIKLVSERGYRRVRLADIAADAGVSKATVYHYFDNKDELLTRAVSARIAEMQADAERMLADRQGPASARLRLYLDHFWRFTLTAQAGMWHRLLVSEIVTDAPQLFTTWARGLLNRWDRVQRLIEEGQATGEFRRDADAAVSARLIISGLSHQALFHVHFGLQQLAPCAPDRIFEASVDQFLHGLSTTASIPG